MNPFEKQPQTLRQQTQEWLKTWDWRFPFDLWWRRKHGVAYGSPAHRAMSLLDIYAEYEEQIQVRAWTAEVRTDDWGLNRDGCALHTTQAEIDTDYDNIDLNTVAL